MFCSVLCGNTFNSNIVLKGKLFLFPFNAWYSLFSEVGILPTVLTVMSLVKSALNRINVQGRSHRIVDSLMYLYGHDTVMKPKYNLRRVELFTHRIHVTYLAMMLDVIWLYTNTVIHRCTITAAITVKLQYTQYMLLLPWISNAYLCVCVCARFHNNIGKY